MNVYVQEHLLSIVLGVYLGMELLGRVITVGLPRWG